jgi:hypothetical protein
MYCISKNGRPGPDLWSFLFLYRIYWTAESDKKPTFQFLGSTEVAANKPATTAIVVAWGLRMETTDLVPSLIQLVRVN